MSQDHDRERRRLAYRQAGEAVARYTQGRPVPDLAVDRPPAPALPGEGRSARARQVDLGSGTRHKVEMEILARWSGLLAEARACLGDREPSGGWGAAGETLAALGRRVTRRPDENDAYLQWLQRRALGLIDLPDIWAAVEAVAETLLADGKLGSREVSEIVAGVHRARRRRSGLAGWFRNPR